MAGLAALASPITAKRQAERSAVRDTAWFSRLYETTIDSVYRYACVLVRDADRAEDVAADVYLRAWRGRDGLRDDQSAVQWLLSITHNSAMSMLRADREVAGIDGLEETEDLSADPSQGLWAQYETSRVHDAIRRLTPEQQQVVFLRFFEGLPHEEVARRLESNANAIRAIQFRALGRLRKLLQGESVAISS